MDKINCKFFVNIPAGSDTKAGQPESCPAPLPDAPGSVRIHPQVIGRVIADIIEAHLKVAVIAGRIAG